MSILKKSGVGFRITLEYLETRGWGSLSKKEKNMLSGTIYYKGNKDHFLRYQTKAGSEQEIQFNYYSRDITRIEEIVLLEGMWDAKTQKRREKLKRRLFGKREKPKEEYWFDPA